MARDGRIKTIVGLSANFCCSLSIVLLNKWLFSKSKFPPISLTCLHFAATSLGLYISYLIGIFDRKHVPFTEILLLSVTFTGSVIFPNLSLQHNSIGTYQLAKTLITPLVMFIHTYFYEKEYSSKIKATNVPIILGVLCNSYFDIGFTYEGIAYAGAGVFVTAIYQILVQAKQKEYGISSMQLLFYQAPVSTIMLVILVPIMEPPFSEGGILSIEYTQEIYILVGITAFVAFFINITVYWIIGNTSPVAYNMFGHFKFVMTLVLAAVIFKNDISRNQVWGITLTFLGIVLYTKFKLQENALMAKKNELPRTLPMVTRKY